MSSSCSRGLQLWEQIGFSMNVSLYLELQGHGINGDTLSEAFKALQSEHPVLRMAADFSDSGPTFVELADPTSKVETVATLYPDWQSKLQQFANSMWLWNEALVFMELASSGDQHQLFLTINHAGKLQMSSTVGSSTHLYTLSHLQHMTLFCRLITTRQVIMTLCVPAAVDGIGLFYLCSSLLANLSKVSQGQPLTAKAQRPFRDIFSKLDAWMPLNISKLPKPAVPEKYMQPLAADRMLEDVEPHVAAVWSELDSNMTQALLFR